MRRTILGLLFTTLPSIAGAQYGVANIPPAYSHFPYTYGNATYPYGTPPLSLNIPTFSMQYGAFPNYGNMGTYQPWYRGVNGSWMNNGPWYGGGLYVTPGWYAPTFVAPGGRYGWR